MEKRSVESAPRSVILPGRAYHMAPAFLEGTIGEVLCLCERKLLIPNKLRALRESLNRVLYAEHPYTERLIDLCLFGEITNGVARCIAFEGDRFLMRQEEISDPWNQNSDRLVWEDEEPLSSKDG